MKKYLLACMMAVTSLCAQDEFEDEIDIQPTIRVNPGKESLIYANTGTFCAGPIPYGIYGGAGIRCYGESFALGASTNLSAALTVFPMFDLTLEGLYFVDSMRYIGIQVGACAGKNFLPEVKYTDGFGEKRTFRFKEWIVSPMIKFIPYGTEWEYDGIRQFAHVAVYPGGVSFNYGWEL